MGVVGAQKAEASRVARNRESYVVIHAGSEAQQGPSYKQERIVLLQSDASMLSAATSMKASGFLVTLLALSAAFLFFWAQIL